MKKEPRNFSGGELCKLTGRKKKKKTLIPNNDEKFQIFNDIEWVRDWVNAETMVREWKYFPLKQIIAVCTIGMSFDDVIEGWESPKHTKLELDTALKFTNSKSRKEDKKFLKINKATTNSKDFNFIEDKIYGHGNLGSSRL